MDSRESTPEEIKKTLKDMLDCRGNAMAVSRSMVASTLNYIWLLERREKAAINKLEYKCALCRHNEEYTCNDDFDCDTCPHAECKCRKCLSTNDAAVFQWRDDL